MSPNPVGSGSALTSAGSHTGNQCPSTAMPSVRPRRPISLGSSEPPSMLSNIPAEAIGGKLVAEREVDAGRFTGPGRHGDEPLIERRLDGLTVDRHLAQPDRCARRGCPERSGTVGSFPRWREARPPRRRRRRRRRDRRRRRGRSGVGSRAAVRGRQQRGAVGGEAGVVHLPLGRAAAFRGLDGLWSVTLPGAGGSVVVTAGAAADSSPPMLQAVAMSVNAVTAHPARTSRCTFMGNLGLVGSAGADLGEPGGEVGSRYPDRPVLLPRDGGDRPGGPASGEAPGQRSVAARVSASAPRGDRARCGEGPPVEVASQVGGHLDRPGREPDRARPPRRAIRR